MSDLTAKQERFVKEYVMSGNATDAAIKAGYSEKTAGSIGSENLTKPEIMAAIEARREKLAKKIDINHETILFELARLGFSDLRRAVVWDENGVTLKASSELDDDTAAAIQEVSADKDGKVKIKFHPKHAALVDLGKFLGMTQADMMAAVLAKMAGQDPNAPPPVSNPRDAARRVALLLREGRLGAP